MGISKEAEISIAASSVFPGFRFSPTDEELILFYLKKKVDGYNQSVEVINEVDICKHEPWDLPAKSIIKSDHEWFFFSPRGKKYPNGSQSKRATEIGYWKATGKERSVKSGPEAIGTKRTLVFHIGRAPKGERTAWIMHEYCLLGNSQDSLVICRLRRKNDSTSTSLEVGNSNPSLPQVDGASSGSGWDPNRMSTEKAVQCCSKKCTSSHDSHSVEQSDHASESVHKLRDEGMEPESSSQLKGKGHNEDDCFADILKDNIIELDESALQTRSNAGVRMQQGSTSGQQHRPPEAMYEQPLVSRMNLPQGTANRRIRLKKPRKELYKAKKEDEVEGNSKRRWVGMRLTRKTNRLYVVMIISGLVAVVLIVLGQPWQPAFCLRPDVVIPPSLVS
ncbi:hypothetical protein V2J09_019131 [Rumex salicifolius]